MALAVWNEAGASGDNAWRSTALPRSDNAASGGRACLEFCAMGLPPSSS